MPLTKAMAALQALGVALASAKTEQEVAEAVAEHVVDALEEGGGCIVTVTQGDEVEIIGARGLYAEAMQRYRRFPRTAPLPANRAMSSREPLFYPDRDTYLAAYPQRIDAAPKTLVQAVCAVPLFIGDECIGALGLSFTSARSFDTAERGYILTFARMCAQSLDRVRQHAAANREAARLSVLVDAARLFAQSAPLDGVLDRVARRFADVVGDSCSIWLLSEDERTALPAALRFRSDDITEIARKALSLRSKAVEEFPIGAVRAANGPVRIGRAEMERIAADSAPEFQRLAERWPSHNAVAVPLWTSGRLAGAVVMTRALTPNAYTDDDVALLVALADHAGLAIERARLEQRERARRDVAERARQQALLLADLTGALAEPLELDQVLARMASRVLPGLTDCFVVDLVEQGELRQTLVRHIDPALAAHIERTRLRYRHASDERLPAPHSASDRRATLLQLDDEVLRSMSRSPEHFEAMRVGRGISAIYAPMVARGRLVGVLTFTRVAGHPPFDDEDLSLCEELAARAALAIDNLRLFAETRAALRLREQFLSIASHELKTPVAALLLQLEALRKVLRNGGAEDIAGPWPDRIARQTRRLVRLVDDLLDVSRIESGRMALERDRCELDALADEVVARLREQDDTAITVVCADAPIVGEWDRARLDQVLTNLVVNAHKYGKPPIEVRLSAEASRARIEVHDHGPGIPPSDRERIFEPFERGSGARHGGGFGLGLFIVKSLVDAHGGTVHVECEEGTTFVVELPIRSTP